MDDRITLCCDRCGKTFTCAPAQASRPLGSLCGSCLGVLPAVRPPGYEKTTWEAVAEEQKARRAEFLPPVSPIRTDVLVRVEQHLDRMNGITCVPNFLKKLYLQMIRNESDAFLERYRRDHLDLIRAHIDPLDGEIPDLAHPGFRELCAKLRDAPNLGFVGLVLGFDEPDDLDPTLWLSWAIRRQEDPVVCLYCVSNFLAVPPFAGTVPRSVEGAVRTLAAMSLTALQRVASALDVIEVFLGLSPADYQTVDALAKALKRSPLQELEVVPRRKMTDTLLLSLAAVPERGPGQADILRRANERVTW